MVTLEKETLAALQEIQAHLVATQRYLAMIRHKMMYARPSEQPIPTSRRVDEALKLLNQILDKGR